LQKRRCTPTQLLKKVGLITRRRFRYFTPTTFAL
jgi:hypothetical protein